MIPETEEAVVQRLTNAMFGSFICKNLSFGWKPLYFTNLHIQQGPQKKFPTWVQSSSRTVMTRECFIWIPYFDIGFAYNFQKLMISNEPIKNAN